LATAVGLYHEKHTAICKRHTESNIQNYITVSSLGAQRVWNAQVL